ncbi:MAG: hypothetical protein PVI97_14400 [Candidatus Thiodiazotropha sp.]|jgi:hypothetical protein
MKIKKDQFDAGLLANEETFIDFISEHLKDESYDYVKRLPDDALKEMIANGLKRARGYGFKAANDLTAFVVFMFETAPNFDEHPTVNKIFKDNSIPIDQRFDCMLKNMTDEEWEEAHENYDEDAWFPEDDDDYEEIY